MTVLGSASHAGALGRAEFIGGGRMEACLRTATSSYALARVFSVAMSCGRTCIVEVSPRADLCRGAPEHVVSEVNCVNSEE